MTKFREQLASLLEEACNQEDDMLALTGIAASAIMTVEEKLGKSSAFALVQVLKEGLETEWASGESDS